MFDFLVGVNVYQDSLLINKTSEEFSSGKEEPAALQSV